MGAVKVYIAGPYTNGDVAVNVRGAITAGQRALEAGHTPFVPHLTHFWHLLFPQGWDLWMAMDKEWLALCDVVWRLPGRSDGADEEVKLAESLGIPVVHTISELTELHD